MVASAVYQAEREGAGIDIEGDRHCAGRLFREVHGHDAAERAGYLVLCAARLAEIGALGLHAFQGECDQLV